MQPALRELIPLTVSQFYSVLLHVRLTFARIKSENVNQRKKQGPTNHFALLFSGETPYSTCYQM